MTAAGDLAPASGPTLRVVSVSLGSSRRNHAVVVDLLGTRFCIERIGVDGDYQRACDLIRELDGRVAAIGLGGTDLYVVARKRRYIIEESRRLAESAKVTPVVDGSGLKNTLEREVIRQLVQTGQLPLQGKKVLLVSAMDRFGMADAFLQAGCDVIFGDIIFALGLPIPIRSLRMVDVLAFIVLPIIRRLPIRMIYPTGDLQTNKPRHHKFFAWADIIAGDFLYILRNMPEDMTGKIIVTNTTTQDDVKLLTQRGASMLVTTTPELSGRSFGTNVMEGVFIALAGKRPEAMAPDDYLQLLKRLDWKPRVKRL